MPKTSKEEGEHNGSKLDKVRSQSGAPTSTYMRGLQVVELLAKQSMSASEVARELGVNRSTALRLLQDLVDGEYVIRDLSSKRYSTSMPRLWSLLSHSRDHQDVSEVIDPILSSARATFGEAAIFAVPANGSMVYAAFFPSVQAIAVTERLGAVRPIHCSALGKAYLGSLDDDSVDRELGRINFEGGTLRAARGPIELRERILGVKEIGYSIDDEETFEGAICVAVAVKIAGVVIGSAGVSGPAGRMDPATQRKIGEWLVSSVADLGEAR